jgi:CMP-N,N'-diacetyllegionaminic acid synthase
MRNIALVPARSGSERVKNKNIRLLGGKPLIHWTLDQIYRSEIFDKVCVSSDSIEYINVCKSFTSVNCILRPEEFATSTSPDLEWILHVVRESRLNAEDRLFILRPTAPFRTVDSIHVALQKFLEADNVDSLRAVKLTDQHPGKMWTLSAKTMSPLFPFINDEVPWHSHQTKVLPEIYMQTATLEVTTVKQVLQNQSLSGEIILPLVLSGIETFDINTEDDFSYAEFLISKK